jgi:hypothetical protein
MHNMWHAAAIGDRIGGMSNCAAADGRRKSSRSAGNGQCVVAGHVDASVAVRDTTTRDLTLTFPGDVWMKFISTLK